jgi:hypothetical protein
MTDFQAQRRADGSLKNKLTAKFLQGVEGIQNVQRQMARHGEHFYELLRSDLNAVDFLPSDYDRYQ